MGAINAYSGEEFPGAQSTIETDVAAGDCPRVPDFEDLVKELETVPAFASTIRYGRAYTIANEASLATFCTIP